MVLQYEVSPYPTLFEDMVVKVSEAQNDALVYQQVLPQDVGGGHANPVSVVINGLDRVVHIVRLFTAGGVKLHEYNAQPLSETVTIYDPIYFKIGDGGAKTPAVNAASYVDANLIGVHDNEYKVYRNEYGRLFPNIHYNNDESTGGFTLAAGDVFGDLEEFSIDRSPGVATGFVNDSVVGKWFGGFLDVPADKDYDPSDLRKIIRFTDNASYSFPPLVDVPIGYGFCFNNSTDNKVGIIDFRNKPLLWKGGNKSSVEIHPSWEGMFVFDGNNWNVIYYVQSNFADAVVPNAPQPGQIVAWGVQAVGDVAAGDPVYDIIHGKNIAGDYMVVFSLKSNTVATAFRDNKVTGTWFHDAADKANRFHITLQELSGEVQDISISWLIIKL